MKTLLSIIIPARDEEDNIGETIKNILPYITPENTEILVVNDHSKDNTIEIVKNLEKHYSFIKLIDNTGEPGFANTLREGFKSAKGEFVLPVMADSCDTPETIPLMVEKAKQGYDLICGSRYVKGGKRVGGPLVQGFFSRFVGITLHILTGIPTRDVANAFKMYRKEKLLSINFEEKGFALSMEICVKFFIKGYKICDVPTIWYGRRKGKSKFKLSKTLPYIRLYLWTLKKRWIYQ
ncbi:MAG: glycosyltransferase family 2 protein [Candidatus Omnitrophica bacterium]|nr:glycosyltransferase family 2 protein [Candidatus Omnitrophota bacterium]